MFATARIRALLATAAVAAVSIFVVPPTPAAASTVTAADRAYVRLLARVDPRSTVKATAWAALISSNVDAAVTRFFASDYDYAVRRAAAAKVRNADFARRVLETHTAEFAPEVHAAAEAAYYGNATDQEYFARTGYDAAKERDRQAREAGGAQAAALAQADRDFVALLRDHDPGEQVRAAAAFALRPAATDADLVDFFAHDWVGGAALDLEAFRIRCADADVRRRAQAARLVADARAAEQAARDTAGEAADQARAAAARAWATVGEQTGPARVAWAQAQQHAEAQAANWQQVAQAAGSATGINWQAVAGTAGATAETWAAERQNAADQAAYWEGLYAEALAGERGMSGGAR
jgi:hypothetical protein